MLQDRQPHTYGSPTGNFCLDVLHELFNVEGEELLQEMALQVGINAVLQMACCHAFEVMIG